MQDLVQLIDIIATLEERLAAQQLSQNTTNGPNIDCDCQLTDSHPERLRIRTGFGIALEAQHDLRRSVPSGSYVFGHVSCILFRVHGEASCQTKIADLEFAVGVHEEITGLEIAVEDVGRVDVLETAQDLVYERLEVGVGERLTRADNGCQIALH